MTDPMIELARTKPAMFNGWQVLHLAGHAADEPLREAYAKAGVRATVLPFVHEMGLAWGAAELAISRAGANSVAEIHANAVPALFLPYPHHADMHQRHNAQPLVEIGGAAMEVDHIDAKVNAANIGPVIESLLGDQARRGRIRSALKANPLADAATTIAKMALGLTLHS
jgi:UDP-N-acetylglucosamine--N-acetylmuramyl-(pentapeptide) pyrophosphoryl-undecaprenol N-acetylglucosamine transferase